MKLLEGVQHRATRMVSGFSNISYEERLKRSDLHSLAYRRVRGDAIETFKYLNGIYKVDCNDILPRHRNTGISTRGHILKLQKRSCTYHNQSNALGYSIVNLWNSLPGGCVVLFNQWFQKTFRLAVQRQMSLWSFWRQILVEPQLISGQDRSTGSIPILTWWWWWWWWKVTLTQWQITSDKYR